MRSPSLPRRARSVPRPKVRARRGSLSFGAMAPAGQPLADVADARSYLPRPASDEVLAALTAWLDGKVATAVVAGAPGVGTTLLLRVLEQRERARHRRVLFAPILHVEPEALQPLEHWLATLARDTTSGVPYALLAGELGTRPLLLVDDAHAATPSTLEALAHLRRTRAPELRICLGGYAGPALASAAQAVGGAEVLTLALPEWSAEELRRLAEALCAHPALDAGARQRLAGADLAGLAAAAEGSPRRLRNALMERSARAPAERPVLAQPPPVVPPITQPITPSTTPPIAPSTTPSTSRSALRFRRRSGCSRLRPGVGFPGSLRRRSASASRSA